jgi:dipeptidyl-peptidase-4
LIKTKLSDRLTSFIRRDFDLLKENRFMNRPLRFPYQRFVTVFLAIILLAACASGFAQEAKLPLKLEDLYASAKFAGSAFHGGQWAEKGAVITFVKTDTANGATHIMSYDLERNQQRILLDGNRLQAADVDRRINIENYAFNHDRSAVLIYTDSAPVWRLNTRGYNYVYDFASGSLTPISAREKGYQMFAKFSPDGRHVAFVRERNLFLVELAGMNETQLTFDGSEGKIINGTSDWVYEEEFFLRDGWSWSPDGKYLAFFQFDESNTSDFFMADLRGSRPELKKFRFPLAGEPNSEIRIGVIDVATKKSQFFDTGTWQSNDDAFEYIPRMGWTPALEGKPLVWIIRLNRDQNHLALLHGNPENRQVKIVFEEQSDTWVEPTNFLSDHEKLVYLADGQHFLWQSERDGYNHLYLYKTSGGPAQQLTRGAWEVTQFHGYDAKARVFYFTANAETPIARHLYRQALDLNKMTNGDAAQPVKITREPGTHTIEFSRDRRYYLDTYSSRNTPAVTRLHKADGTIVKYLEENAALKRTLAEYEFPKSEFITVPEAGSARLHGYMIKPTYFDPAKKYPLLMFTYGGPGVQNVTDAWDALFGLWHAYLAQQGFIVACVDNRGAHGYGKAFESALYMNAGTVEPQDQIAAAKYFGALPYIDKDRIGIWGWSYGGYNTLLALTKYDGPQVFKLGVAIAPGGDWEAYDTIYTERYMSTPQKNPEGYQQASPLNFVRNMAEHQRLLIVHGDQDDNVHFQSTLHLLTALQRNNKRFQFMLYPGGNHSLQGTRNPLVYLHLFGTLTDFVKANL